MRGLLKYVLNVFQGDQKIGAQGLGWGNGSETGSPYKYIDMLQHEGDGEMVLSYQMIDDIVIIM